MKSNPVVAVVGNPGKFGTRFTYQGRVYSLYGVYPHGAQANAEAEYLRATQKALTVIRKIGGEYGVYHYTPRRPGPYAMKNARDKRGRFKHRRLSSPKRFDARSFRIKRVSPDGTEIVVGCPKGQWSPTRERCKVGTRAQAVLTPNPKPGDIISDSVIEIRYIHRGNGRRYFHPFKAGVRMVAERDGSLRIYHPSKPVWAEFD